MPLAARVRGLSARLLSALTLALVAYVVVQSAAPLLEHDLVCHLKSRTHCTVCATGVSAPGLAEAAAPAPVGDLPCADTIEFRGDRVASAPPVGATQNRAPPA